MVETNNIPRHVAIIMDGNGRWAQNRGKERIYGHIKGVDSVRKVIKSASDCGVEFLTLFVFSTENWGRPQTEVSGLMELLCESIVKELDSLLSEDVRVRIIGEKDNMPAKVKEHLHMIEKSTSSCKKLNLVLALNYGSHEEITYAVRKIYDKIKTGELGISEITPELIAENLFTSDIPDPDLLIRTSGEQRLSNFMLWQSAYTELYFTEILWPDFGEKEFCDALADYAGRERRYGLVTKQKP